MSPALLQDYALCPLFMTLMGVPEDVFPGTRLN